MAVDRWCDKCGLRDPDNRTDTCETCGGPTREMVPAPAPAPAAGPAPAAAVTDPNFQPYKDALGVPHVDAGTEPPAPLKPAVDALSALIGVGKARAIRVAVSFLVGLLARRGVPAAISGPIVDSIIEGLVTAGLVGLGKKLRDGFDVTIPAKVPIYGGRKVHVSVPDWFPI